MPKASHFFLLCGVLAAPFLGASSAHAASIVNHFGLCLDDQSGATQDRNPIVARRCFGLFQQQWGVGWVIDIGHRNGRNWGPGTAEPLQVSHDFFGSGGNACLIG
jgi:hypothetical protein